MIDCLLCTVPTDNTAGVCSFCLDYEAPGPRLNVNDPCWLTAQGDTSRVEVYRSPVVMADSGIFAPVREHVEAHGLTLVYTETDEDPEWMYGERIREIYA